MLTLDTEAISHPRRSTASIMRQVMIALIPGIVLYTLTIDSRLPLNLLLASAAALCFEAALVKLRRRAILPVLKDSSVVLAAILLVLSVPQSLPHWQLIFAVFILCTLGKHVFGGLGHNPFNPAMVAYAVLIVSFPLTMTQWSTENGLLDSNTAETLQTNHVQNEQLSWDGITGATPLDRIRNLQRSASHVSDDANVDDQTNPDSEPGIEITNAQPAELLISSDWLWLSITWLIGGLYLLYLRIISWRIPVTLLATMWCLYAMYAALASTPVLPASLALFSGAIMLGAFFIATDPVSAATSNPGKLVYAIGIGVLCFVIREFSAYPEGMAFAVLLMNMCVPLIDHAFTRNRIHIPIASNNRNDR